MAWKKATNEEVNQRANRNPDSDIALAGPFHGSNSTLLWYCYKCENYFRQSYRSLQRGFKTRCKCNHSEHISPEDARKAHFAAKGMNGFSGHTCLPEWECYDRTPPPRPPKEPQDRV
tara:strand:+ start:1026 stop:1376 length:351 start_codon:yes stop_codon:yes gene_type:complete